VSFEIVFVVPDVFCFFCLVGLGTVATGRLWPFSSEVLEEGVFEGLVL
jgi:hypothetical protein